MTEHSLDEWTPEERQRLAEVGQHRSPRSELKGRTTRALRERRLLGVVEPRRPRWQLAIGLAAAIVIFAAGMLTGYGVGQRRQAGSPRGLITNTSGPANEVARLDSPSTQSPLGGTARHVIWF